MAVTVKQIAERAGVSHPVVSKVLYGGTSTVNVSQKRREQILQVAKELGFTPDWRARAFREKRTRTVGLLSIDRFYAQQMSTRVLAGLVHHLGERDYQLAFATRSGTKGWKEIIGDRRFDGCLIDYYIDEAEVEAAERSGVPLALLNANPVLAKRLGQFPLVGCDYAALGEAAARELVALGADRLWLAVDRVEDGATADGTYWHIAARAEGVRRAAEAAGVPVEAKVWSETLDPIEAHAKGGRPGVIPGGPFRADLMLGALARRGLRLPEDVLMISAGSSGNPQVAYVPEPFERMTEYAVAALMRLMRPDDEIPSPNGEPVPGPGDTLLLPPGAVCHAPTSTGDLPPDVKV